MPRALVDAAVGSGFGPHQWLALLGAAMLSVWALTLAVFLCGSKTAKRGGGKAPAPSAQELASRGAPTAATRTRCDEAPTPEIASRNAAAATGGCCGPKESHRCCRCAGSRQCGGPCGPCGYGSGADGGDCCCCCVVDCSDCDCSGVDCDGCDCSGCDCGGCDCSGVDCGGCDCI